MSLRRSLQTLSAVLFIAVLAVSAAWADDKPTKPTPIRVFALQGENITIALRSNPTTGYQWTLLPLQPHSVITIDKGAFVRPQSNLTGAPGWMVWHVNAKDLGLTTLTFQYARSFEKTAPPARTVVVVVRCDPHTSAVKTGSQVFYCQPNDAFDVTLPNPQDGFQWNILDKSYDGGVLLSLGRTQIPGKPGKPGTPPMTVQHFRAVGVGSTKATLMYQKPGVEQAAVSTTVVRVEK